MLSVVMLSVLIQNAVMLSVIMLNAIMLSVIVLNAVVPFPVVAIKCLLLQTLLSGLLSTSVFFQWQPFSAKFNVYKQGRIPLEWSTSGCPKVSYLSETKSLAYSLPVFTNKTSIYNNYAQKYFDLISIQKDSYFNSFFVMFLFYSSIHHL